MKASIRLVVALACTFWLPPLTSQTVVFGSFPAAMPYGGTTDGQLVRGLIFDLSQLISAELGLTVDYNLTPKKRTDYALENDLINIIPFANPAWFPKHEDFVWSVALFTEADVFVTLAAKSLVITKTSELSHLVVGTMRGYVYPEIEPMLAKGLFLRDDATSLTANLKRLQLGFVDAVYDSDILIRHKMASNPGQFQIQPLQLESHTIHWAISKSSGVPAEKILSFLSRKVKDGTIKRLLDSYR